MEMSVAKLSADPLKEGIERFQKLIEPKQSELDKTFQANSEIALKTEEQEKIDLIERITSFIGNFPEVFLEKANEYAELTIAHSHLISSLQHKKTEREALVIEEQTQFGMSQNLEVKIATYQNDIESIKISLSENTTKRDTLTQEINVLNQSTPQKKQVKQKISDKKRERDSVNNHIDQSRKKIPLIEIELSRFALDQKSIEKTLKYTRARIQKIDESINELSVGIEKIVRQRNGVFKYLAETPVSTKDKKEVESIMSTLHSMQKNHSPDSQNPL